MPARTTRAGLALVFLVLLVQPLAAPALAGTSEQPTEPLSTVMFEGRASAVGGPQGGMTSASSVQAVVPDGATRAIVEVGWVEPGREIVVNVHQKDPNEAHLEGPRAYGQGRVEATAELPVAPARANGALAHAAGPSPQSTSATVTDVDKVWVQVSTTNGTVADRAYVGTIAFYPAEGQAADDRAQAAEPPTPPDPDRRTTWTVTGGLTMAGVALYLLGRRLNLVLLALYHRIRRERLLDHPSRARIVDEVTAEPGIHFERLARQAELGRGNLDHHLVKLLDGRILVERHLGGYRCFFHPDDVGDEAQVVAASLKAETARTLLRRISRDPDQGVRALARALDLAPSTVSFHIDRLRREGLVCKTPPDEPHPHAVTPLGQDVLSVLSS